MHGWLNVPDPPPRSQARWTVVEALAVDDRRALMLVDGLGLSPVDAAAVMGIAVPVFAIHLDSARRAFAAAARDGPGEPNASGTDRGTASRGRPLRREAPMPEIAAMDLEDRIRDALVAELRRQADRPDFTVADEGESTIRVDGVLDLDDLVMALIGSLAGGP